MTKYICNDCSGEYPFVGECKLELPRIAGHPRRCPVCGGAVECNWRKVEG
jgi:DNA-directed RNA polymerase subunit RPC12/RpoP